MTILYKCVEPIGGWRTDTQANVQNLSNPNTKIELQMELAIEVRLGSLSNNSHDSYSFLNDFMWLLLMEFYDIKSFKILTKVGT